jgi:lipopolysaccharide export system permease protein
MRILDNYILRSVVSIFCLCLFVFLFLYIIIDLFSHLDDILKQHTSILVLKDYYLAHVPIIFVQVVPISCLLATLYTFARLNRDNEIIAIRAAGLSILDITRVVIVFGALLSLVVFWVNDTFVPPALAMTQKLKKQMESNEKKDKGQSPETIKYLSMYGLKNRLFFVNKFSTATNTMEGIVILEHDEKQNITKKIMAQEGIYKDGVWRFYRCTTFFFDEEGQVVDEPQYMEEEIMTITETPEEFLNQRQQPEFMTIAQLDNYIWKLSRSGAIGVIRNLKVDLYQRFTVPFTSVIIILLGIPFALIIKRRATGLSSLGLSIIMGFLYYVLSAICVALGKGAILPPLLSVSITHILALFFSLFLITSIP